MNHSPIAQALQRHAECMTAASEWLREQLAPIHEGCRHVAEQLTEQFTHTSRSAAAGAAVLLEQLLEPPSPGEPHA